MKLEHLLQAIEVCDQGFLQFNLGHKRAFLFGKKWYPLRATINHGRSINKESALTTDRALLELIRLLPYSNIKEIYFSNSTPVVLTQTEITEEVNKITHVLKSLT